MASKLALLSAAAGIAVLAAGTSSPAQAETVVDQFGQALPEALAATVDRARQLRLSYVPGSDPGQSAALLEGVVAEQDDYFRAWFNLALAYAELGELEQANAAFDRAIAIRIDQGIEDISVFNSAGWVNMNAGNLDIAEAYFSQALENQAQGSEQTLRALYNNVGLLYFYTQRLDEAQRYLSVARDTYGSRSAADTLRMIEGTRERIERAQESHEALAPP